MLSFGFVLLRFCISVSSVACVYSLQEAQHHHYYQHPLEAETHSTSGRSLRTCHTHVSSVALTLEVLIQHCQLLLVHLPTHSEPTIVHLQRVCTSAQVQVGIRVWEPAQAASTPPTQLCTALLSCRGNVEQVAAKGARAEVLPQAGAALLHVMTKHKCQGVINTV